jgi:tetratricopeptide (TPR) repeat protein
MQTPKRQLKGYQDLNNDPSRTQTQTPLSPLSPSSLVEQGLSLLGLSPASTSTSTPVQQQPSSQQYSTPNRRRRSSPQKKNRSGLSPGPNSTRKNSKSNIRRRSNSAGATPTRRSNNNNTNNNVQFLSSDDSSMADLLLCDDGHDIDNTSASPLNKLDHNNINTATSLNNNSGRKARRRRLNWRVGPLQKKRKPKSLPPPKNNRNRNHSNHPMGGIGMSSNRSLNSSGEDNSIAERTVKSFHTFHSTETVKVGNSPMTPAQQQQQQMRRQQQLQQQHQQLQLQQQQQLQDHNEQTATLFIPQSPHTPNSKNMILPSLYQKASALLGTPSTVASTELSDYDIDSDNDNDDGSIITPLESPQSEETNRTIGLFLYDSEKENHRTQIGMNTSSPSNSNNNGYMHTPMKGRIQQQKRLGGGLPPRSPHITSGGSLYSDGSNFKKSLQQYGDDTIKEDDSVSNQSGQSGQSGGPLWQLAKLQAISEGKIPTNMNNSNTSSASSTGSQNSSYNNRNSKQKQWRNKKNQSSTSNLSSSSSSRSVTSNVTTTDYEDIQIKHAERNLKAIHTLAQQHLQFNEIPEAIDVLQEMLRGVKELHGEDHYRVGTVLHNLSTVYMRSRQFRKAILYCRQAVDVRKNALGLLHPDLAVSLSQLGIAHLELEEYDAAVQQFKAALNVRRNNMSHDDPKIARLLNNIGCSLYESGKLEEAAKAFEEALAIQKSLMHGAVPGYMKSPSNCQNGNGGNRHNVGDVMLSISSTLCNLGSVKMRWRKYDEAVQALEEALLLQQSLLGDDHPTVQSTKDSIDLVNSSARSKGNDMVSP